MSGFRTVNIFFIESQILITIMSFLVYDLEGFEDFMMGMC